MTALWMAIGMLSAIGIWVMAHAVGECRRSRRAGWVSAKKMLLSEILLRLGAGEVLRIFLFKPNGELPLGLRLEEDSLKLTEGPELPEPRRTTYPIGWERLVELLVAHIRCDLKHPFVTRREKFAKEAEALMLGIPAEISLLADRLSIGEAIVRDLEQRY